MIETKNTASENPAVINLNALYLNNGISIIEVNWQSIHSMQYSPIDYALNNKMSNCINAQYPLLTLMPFPPIYLHYVQCVILY